MNALAIFFFAGVALLVWQAIAATLNARHARLVAERWVDLFIAHERAKRAGRDRWGRFKTLP